MLASATRHKNKGFSIISAVLLTAVSTAGLQSCSSGGGDSAPVVPGVTLNAASISEGNSGTANLDFTVTLSEATTVAITVDYATSDDTATAGQDYTATSGTLTVPANSTSATISVPVIGEAITEADETFNLQVSNAGNATITNGSMTVSGEIINDDLAGYYTGSISVNEDPGLLVLADPEIQVIVANDRLVIINISTNLVYIAPLTGFSQNTFSTTARIYKAGDFQRTTQITGTFISGASLNLTLTGSGDYTAGTVTLVYNTTENSLAPYVLVDSALWNGPDLGILVNNNTNISFGGGNSVPSTFLKNCASTVDLTNVVSEQTGRIRSFSAIAAACTDISVNGTILDGYLTRFKSTVDDDRLLFVWFNADGVHAEVMIK